MFVCCVCSLLWCDMILISAKSFKMGSCIFFLTQCQFCNICEVSLAASLALNLRKICTSFMVGIAPLNYTLPISYVYHSFSDLTL